MASIHLLGIRHHGPGSARSVAAALEVIRPDLLLVEMPEDAQDAIPVMMDEGLVPPVALLLYSPEDVARASFYPFAHFSPEWVAFRWALSQGAHYRCFDLPKGMALAADAPPEVPTGEMAVFRGDPIQALAQMDGYEDGERWWESRFEAQAGPLETFTAVAELMRAVRFSPGAEWKDDAETLAREAWMRGHLRQAVKEGYKQIAVVCGAYHVPALELERTATQDKEPLKGWKKTKVATTWVPWTYERLSMASGYGAGIHSPHWYGMLFDSQDPQATISQWVVQSARVLRKEGHEVSSAHAIEAVRLAGTLATLRGMEMPGIHELMESMQSVCTAGHPEPLGFIRRHTVIGVKMGTVPDHALKAPILEDLAREQRRLKLTPSPEREHLELDLRKELHLGRSKLIHRLQLIHIPWGTAKLAKKGQGTFREEWMLQWEPEFSIRLVEAGLHGNTIADAATGMVLHEARELTSLVALTQRLQHLLMADLPLATEGVVIRLRDVAALSPDVGHLIQTLRPLVETLRYGNVRKTDSDSLVTILDQLIPRICIHLPPYCLHLTEEAEQEIWKHIREADTALRLHNAAQHLESWRDALLKITEMQGASPLIQGGAVRLLLDHQAFTTEHASLLLGRSLSPGVEPLQAARWVEGFLSGGASLLLHNHALFQLLQDWAASLSSDDFVASLPLLRRAFSQFSSPERARLLDKVGQGTRHQPAAMAPLQQLHPQRTQQMDAAFLQLIQLIYPAPDHGDQ